MPAVKEYSLEETYNRLCNALDIATASLRVQLEEDKKRRQWASGSMATASVWGNLQEGVAGALGNLGLAANPGVVVHNGNP